MKTIGLIGGMSWESTLVYYRLLNEGVRARRGALHSADVLLRSLDFESVVRLQKAGRWDEAGALLGAAGAGLARAGAGCLLICTNTMHLVSDAVARAGGVPLIDIIAETGRAVATAGCRRPLLLATRYTMEHGFYAERMRASAGIDPMVPEAEDRALVHGIIFDELCQGIVQDASRVRLLEVIRRGVAAGAPTASSWAAPRSAFCSIPQACRCRASTRRRSMPRRRSISRSASSLPPSAWPPDAMCRFLAYAGAPTFLDRLPRGARGVADRAVPGGARSEDGRQCGRLRHRLVRRTRGARHLSRRAARVVGRQPVLPVPADPLPDVRRPYPIGDLGRRVRRQLPPVHARAASVPPQRADRRLRAHPPPRRRDDPGRTLRPPPRQRRQRGDLPRRPGAGARRRPGRRRRGDAGRDPRRHARRRRHQAAALRRRPRRRGAACAASAGRATAARRRSTGASRPRAAWWRPSPSTLAPTGAPSRPAACSRSTPEGGPRSILSSFRPVRWPPRERNGLRGRRDAVRTPPPCPAEPS